MAFFASFASFAVHRLFTAKDAKDAKNFRFADNVFRVAGFRGKTLAICCWGTHLVTPFLMLRVAVAQAGSW